MKGLQSSSQNRVVENVAETNYGWAEKPQKH